MQFANQSGNGMNNRNNNNNFNNNANNFRQQQQQNANNKNVGQNNQQNGGRQGQGQGQEWMNGWWDNRDQKTRQDIQRLQQTARMPNKKIKNFPKRHPPTPPDANYNGGNNNQNQ